MLNISKRTLSLTGLVLKEFRSCVQEKVSTPGSTPRCFYCVTSNDIKYNTYKITNNNPGFLEGKYFGVKTFGKLSLDLPFNIDVEPLDMDLFPEMNKMFIRLHYDISPDENVDSATLESLSQCYTFNVNVKEGREISVAGKFKSKVQYPVTCHIQLPLKFDLDIKAKGQSTIIRNMESDVIEIEKNSDKKLQEKRSLCLLKKLKCGKIRIKGHNCDVVSEKLLQGNTSIEINGQGDITTDRLQGLQIQCKTDNGNITCSSVYGEENDFSCTDGNIQLCNCHGKTDVAIKNKGKLSIDGFEGVLNAQIKDGDTNLYVSRAEDINVDTNSGNIDLKVQENVCAKINLSGSTIACDERLPMSGVEKSGECPETLKGSLNGVEGSIKARTKSGKITLDLHDWLSSVKINIRE